jgi:dipeptidyl aminopeptidase/acylaminoacyl peptidase
LRTGTVWQVSHRSGDWRARFLQPTVGFPSWSSSDHDRLAFLSNEGGTTQVWTTHRKLSDRRPLTDQRVGTEDFVMSPNGQHIAWWSDESGDGSGGWVATSIESGDTFDLLTGLSSGWSEGLAWSANRVAIALTDGSRYRVYVGEPGGAGHVVYESSNPAGLGREWTTTPGGLSTDGRLLCVRHSEAGDMLHFALRVVSVDDGVTIDDLVDEGRTLRVASWSPISGDDRVAVVQETDGVERPGLWHPRSRERRNYSSDLPGEMEVSAWYPDGEGLLVTQWYEGRSQLFRLDLASGDYELLHDPSGYISAAGVRPDGEVWLREEAGDRPPVVRTVDGRSVLIAPGKAPDGVPYRRLRFVGQTGEPTHMMLAEPDGSGPHPTLMYVHGGPEWAEADQFDPWTATLVEHGVAVAKVNYRGSTGFGERWRTAIHDGNIGFPEASDVVVGLGYLIDMGIADPTRCAIEGWSWGGYIATLAIGLYPDTFAAAIAGIPVCDSVMTHEDCSPSQKAYDRAIMGGSPSEVPDRYAERSPSTYLDAVRTPLLIIAGEHDSACPIRQVRWYADQLKDRGRSVQLHVYDAGHHANSVEERITQVELELAFLEGQGLVSRDEGATA